MDGGDGMIFTQGGITAGWGFYLQKGKLVGVHNYIGMERYRIASTESVPIGKVTLTFDLEYDGGGMGKGGTITLLVNGKKVDEGRVEKTTGIKYSLYEGQDYRRGQWLAYRFHLHAAVQVRWQVAEGDGRLEINGPKLLVTPNGARPHYRREAGIPAKRFATQIGRASCRERVCYAV